MFYTMEWYEMERKKIREVNDRRSKFKMVNMVRISHMSLSLVTHSFFSLSLNKKVNALMVELLSGGTVLN